VTTWSILISGGSWVKGAVELAPSDIRQKHYQGERIKDRFDESVVHVEALGFVVLGMD
jgi:hypothetical protein